MRLGFTGTQLGMTDAQAIAMMNEVAFHNDYVVTREDEFHHGICVGSDKEAHDLIRAWSGMIIVGHPPSDKSKMADCDCDVLWPEKPYLERNHDIVDATGALIATPNGPEVLRSGTWSTVRYARKLGRAHSIVWPDGSVTRVPRLTPICAASAALF